MASINMQPQVLDLSLYAGDGVRLKLTCTDGTNPIPMSGEMLSQIKVNRASEETIVDFDIDLVDASQGIVYLSLTGADTQALIASPSTKTGKFTGVWDLQWMPMGAHPRTICQGKVDCLIDVTR